jgi:hypothetical protein
MLFYWLPSQSCSAQSQVSSSLSSLSPPSLSDQLVVVELVLHQVLERATESVVQRMVVYELVELGWSE